VAMLILYPLENIRTRLQVQVHQKDKAKKPKVEQNGAIAHVPIVHEVPYEEFKGSFDCVRQVIQREGYKGLYSGMSSALVGIGFSSAIYFFWYNLFKSWTLKSLQHKHLGPLENLGVASVAGIVNVFCTLPIWVINTRMKLQKKGEEKYSGNIDALKRIWLDEGLSGLYQGLVPSLLLVANPAIQFAAYEQMHKFLYLFRKSQQRAFQKPTFLETFVLGAIAKTLATFATYPYQVLKSRMQAEETAKLYKGTLHAIITMFREEGVRVFFLGIMTKLSQTVLNSAFMFVVYEKLVGFFTSLIQWLIASHFLTNNFLLFLIFLGLIVVSFVLFFSFSEKTRSKKKE